MAELALGALGVVPLLGFAIQSYKSLAAKLHMYRHSHKVIHRVYRRLRSESSVFENECELLLRQCLSDGVAERMVMDPRHEGWTDSDMNDRLQEILKRNYSVCIEQIRDIVDMVQVFENELRSFEDLKIQQKKDESLKHTLKRVGDGLKISLNKSSYESNLSDLQASNNTLRCLRKQITELAKLDMTLNSKRAVVSPQYCDIRVASVALHKALAKAWCCRQTSHTRHFVQLFLEAQKLDSDIWLKIAILTYSQTPCPSIPNLIQLQVKSQCSSSWACGLQNLSSHARANEHPQKKRKLDQLDGTLVGCSSASFSSGASGLKVHDSIQFSANSLLDLQCSIDICSDFETRCEQSDKKPSQCVGYIDLCASENYRHLFFPSGSVGNLLVDRKRELVPIDQLFCDTAKSGIFQIHKLEVARSLALAVLSFHKTPWLSEAWEPQDISCFYNELDISSSLQTVHLRAEFNHDPGQFETDTSMGDVSEYSHSSASDLSSSNEDELVDRGIFNSVLYCLGVALLQIDHEKKPKAVDVRCVRRMAKLSSTLGRDYRIMTEKCLRCDFGCGADLGQAQLQNAVYDSVIRNLDSMIYTLKGLEISDTIEKSRKVGA